MITVNQNSESKSKLNAERWQQLQKEKPPISGESFRLITDSACCDLKGKNTSKNNSFHQLFYQELINIEDENENQHNDNNEVDIDSVKGSDIKNCINDTDIDESSSIASHKLAKLLKSKLSKYRNELRQYHNATKDLENTYKKINFELNHMQRKNEKFLAINKYASNNGNPIIEDTISTGSEYSLKRKRTPIFNHSDNLERGTLKKSVKSPLNNTKPYNKLEDSSRFISKRSKPNLNSINSFLLNKCSQHSKHDFLSGETRYESLNSLSNNFETINGNETKRVCHQQLKDIKRLQTTIMDLKSEYQKQQDIIKRQQSCLDDYYSRCLKAGEIMNAQHVEMKKLYSNNEELEKEFTTNIEQLREKLEGKLREVDQLPQMLHEERLKHDSTRKENVILKQRIRAIQLEVRQLKEKLEDVQNKKSTILIKLKAAERDLKIFKNYNSVLKQEKHRLKDELNVLHEQIQLLQNGNKQLLQRQREESEKRCRELQKRVRELELKLKRSENSTGSILKQRDDLIVELQSQINNLVHNFDVSQNHIRVLRRHIYAMSHGAGRGTNAGTTAGTGTCNVSSSSNIFFNNSNCQKQQQQQQQQLCKGNNRVNRFIL